MTASQQLPGNDSLGDNLYALFEVQVFTVPEPSSFALAVPGVLALVFGRRRR